MAFAPASVSPRGRLRPSMPVGALVMSFNSKLSRDDALGGSQCRFRLHYVLVRFETYSTLLKDEQRSVRTLAWDYEQNEFFKCVCAIGPHSKKLFPAYNPKQELREVRC